MSEIFKFIYKGEKSSALSWGGYLLVAAGLFIGVVESIWIGAIILLIGMLVIVYQTGIEIDLQKKMYRLTNNIGPVIFGEWVELPSLKYISVFKTNVSRAYYTRYGNSTTDSDTVIQVNLITSQNKKIKLFQTSNPSKAFEITKTHASKLGLDVWDATTKEGKWL